MQVSRDTRCLKILYGPQSVSTFWWMECRPASYFLRAPFPYAVYPPDFVLLLGRRQTSILQKANGVLFAFFPTHPFFFSQGQYLKVRCSGTLFALDQCQTFRLGFKADLHGH